MKHISELNTILQQFFTWNKARLDCFTRMLLALFSVRTVNLREIAVAFSSDAQIDSRYKRCKRFFVNFKMDMDVIAHAIFKIFFSGIEKFYVTIDRTNWFWGKTKINILTVGIAYEGVAIPILWHLLPKAGNATAAEHRAILQHFVDLFGKERIAGVLGDREFASGKLFKWFNKSHIPFYIRIKEGSNVRVGKKKLYKAKKIFNDLNPQTRKIFPMTIFLFGEQVNLEGSRSERGELMIIATNQEARNAVPIYLRRWEIECLFSCLKTRGFRFEETHLTHLDRIEKLMALLAIGFSWAHKVGEWRAIKKPIPFNKHKESKRPQYSYFRYGFDLIRDAIFCISDKKNKFKQYIRQIFIPDLINLEAL